MVNLKVAREVNRVGKEILFGYRGPK